MGDMPTARRQPAAATAWVMSGLKALASLRLTVVLFALAMVLVFVGTLAQIDSGIWTVVNQYFRSAYVWVPFQLFVKFGQVFFDVPKDWAVPGSFPFVGGWSLGALLLVNLLAAHAVRFKLTWNRAGIVILHAGLIVMMLGELVTGLFAIEGNMTILVGGSSNYLEHLQSVELAFVSRAGEHDDVVVVPGSMLKQGHVVSHEFLPFDLRVEHYLANSDAPRPLKPGETTPATAGSGQSVTVDEEPEVSGTDPNQKVDIPSAFVTLLDKKSGAALGTYLVSRWFSAFDEPPQKVTLGDTAYEMSLRLKRTYKPYTIELLKFTHEVYPGTNTPKDFRSTVVVRDPDRGDRRETEIYMNNPLRYAGETFYQSGTVPSPKEGAPDRGTVLQVVHNPGDWLPYVSCGMVTLGMIIHFMMHLLKFLEQRRLAA